MNEIDTIITLLTSKLSRIPRKDSDCAFSMTFELYVRDHEKRFEIQIRNGELVNIEKSSSSSEMLSIHMTYETLSNVFSGTYLFKDAFAKQLIHIHGNMFHAMKLGAFLDRYIPHSTYDVKAAAPVRYSICEESIHMSYAGGIFGDVTVGYAENARPDSIVFIFPPHPFLGGDMHNSVVSHVYGSLAEDGFVCVRFDYPIEPATDQLHFERFESNIYQEHLMKRIGELISHIQEHISKKAHIHFIGYSYGAIAALAVRKYVSVEQIVLISPPIVAYDISSLLTDQRVHSGICSEGDEFCPAADFQSLSKEYNFPVDCIPDTDHFFRGHEHMIASIVKKHIGAACVK